MTDPGELADAQKRIERYLDMERIDDDNDFWQWFDQMMHGKASHAQKEKIGKPIFEANRERWQDIPEPPIDEPPEPQPIFDERIKRWRLRGRFVKNPY